jgi:GT2 family glycosyltransferase
LPEPRVTVVVPTLAADAALQECLRSLAGQTLREIEVVVVDNSGEQRVAESDGIRVIHNRKNVGFGAAVNQGWADSRAPYLATLNDDAVADPHWLEALVTAMEARPEIGMCASQVRLAGAGLLDSAGMLMAWDGSSKQRGHGENAARYSRRSEVLLPSGSAALYRRAMLDEIGKFDDRFFLYCEDTDLGLRARWAAWECVYVPDAVVEHRYSHSAGRGSSLKAYYVERNRLFLAVKNFPTSALWLLPAYAAARYFWHVVYGMRGQGTTGQFRQEGGNTGQLAGLVWRAHWALLGEWRRLWRERKKMKRRLTPKQFRKLLRSYTITPRQVAAL